MGHPWRDDPLLTGRFHPNHPDDLQVIVHEGGPRLSTSPPELIWVRLDGVLAAGVDRVRRAELLRPLELPVVEIDRDDGGGTGELGPGDGRVADAAAAEDGDGVTTADVAGVHGGPEAGHDAAPEEAGGRRGCGRVDLGGLARRDQRQALSVGVSTWIGIMVGLIAKVVLAFMMIGIFVVALLV